MTWIEAIILGLLQGLTEYLPVSSSGHLAIGSALFGIEGEENLTFTIVVHVATVLSTLVILWKEIDWIFRGLFKFRMNEETKYVLNIIVSMIPVGIVGVFFKDYVEDIFGSGLLIVGIMPVAHSFSAGIFILCQASYKRENQHERCIHYRSGSGLCSNARPFAFRFYHRYRIAIGQQERIACTILVPYGYPSDIG